MAAPYSNIETKLEAAAAAVNTTAANGYTSRAGLDSATKSLPAVLFHAEKRDERPLNSGNYMLTLTITVMDTADSVTLAAHRTGAATVFDLFLDDAIAATLSAAAGVTDFTVLLVTGREGSPTRAEDRQWLSEISLSLYACATDIS